MVDVSKDALVQGMISYGIPAHMHFGLLGYVHDHVPPGGFLTALMSNDLKRTFEKADDVNQRSVLNYIKFLYNCAPAECWGSEEKFKAWISG